MCTGKRRCSGIDQTGTGSPLGRAEKGRECPSGKGRGMKKKEDVRSCHSRKEGK